MNNGYFSNELFLGVVNKVNTYSCYIKVPKPNLLQSFYINGNDYCGGIVGRYVIVYSENLGFLGIIQEISIPKESKYSIDDAESQDDYETFKTDCRIQLLLSFDYHEIENNAICYHSGIKEFPIVSSKVYICHNDLLNKILCGINSKNDKTSIKLGEVVGNKIPFSISIKDLFERHCAIVGTTGGGKSSTIGKIIQEIHSYNQFSDKKMNVILFDATGEFENIKGNGIKKYTFGNSTLVKSDDVSSVYFSYKNLTTSDWFSLFQPSANVQATKLREAIKSLKLQKSLTSTTSLKKSGSSITAFNTNIGTHAASVFDEEKSDFDITLLSEQITNECIYSNDKCNTDKFGGFNSQDEGYCSPLINKINYKIKNHSYNQIFNFTNTSSDYINFVDIFSNNDNANIFIISLKDVIFDDNIRQVLMNCIGRMFLTRARSGCYNFIKDKDNKPTLLILDEAHQFLNYKISGDYAPDIPLNSFDNIAKECRKHGLYLCLSTQMPRDIPSGTLSQVGTFIVHRLINDDDKNKIKDACQESTREILDLFHNLDK